MVFVPFFVVILVLNFTVAYWNVDGSFPNPRLWALGSAVFWGSWLMVAIINLWHCLCFRIRVTEHHITYVGTFGVSQIPVAGLSLRWRSFPGWGSVHLCRGLGRIKIDFGMLEFAEREPLAIWLNQTVPPDAQTNWKEFQTKVVNTEWPKRQSIYDFL